MFLPIWCMHVSWVVTYMISVFSQERFGANCLRSFKDCRWIVPWLVLIQEQRPFLITGVPEGKKKRTHQYRPVFQFRWSLKMIHLTESWLLLSFTECLKIITTELWRRYHLILYIRKLRFRKIKNKVIQLLGSRGRVLAQISLSPKALLLTTTPLCPWEKKRLSQYLINTYHKTNR